MKAHSRHVDARTQTIRFGPATARLVVSIRMYDGEYWIPVKEMQKYLDWLVTI